MLEEMAEITSKADHATTFAAELRARVSRVHDRCLSSAP